MKNFIKKHKTKIAMVSTIAITFVIGYKHGIHHIESKFAKAGDEMLKIIFDFLEMSDIIKF